MDTLTISQYSAFNFFCNRCTIERTDLHSHQFIEIAYVASGKGVHIVQGQEREVAAGSIILVNLGTAHQFVAKKQPFTVINCVFTSDFLNDSLSNTDGFEKIAKYCFPSFVLEEKTNVISINLMGNEKADAANLYYHMEEEFYKKLPGSMELLRSDITHLIVTLLRQSSQPDNGHNFAEIHSALDYIRTHYMENIPVANLAATAFCSKTDFCRKFKIVTGMTVTSFLQTVRVEEACRLAMYTDMSIQEIAHAVGYHDMKHFYKVFRQTTGKTPSMFRQFHT